MKAGFSRFDFQRELSCWTQGSSSSRPWCELFQNLYQSLQQWSEWSPSLESRYSPRWDIAQSVAKGTHSKGLLCVHFKIKDRVNAKKITQHELSSTAPIAVQYSDCNYGSTWVLLKFFHFSEFYAIRRSSDRRSSWVRMLCRELDTTQAQQVLPCILYHEFKLFGHGGISLLKQNASEHMSQAHAWVQVLTICLGFQKFEKKASPMIPNTYLHVCQPGNDLASEAHCTHVGKQGLFCFFLW